MTLDCDTMQADECARRLGSFYIIDGNRLAIDWRHRIRNKDSKNQKTKRKQIRPGRGSRYNVSVRVGGWSTSNYNSALAKTIFERPDGQRKTAVDQT